MLADWTSRRNAHGCAIELSRVGQLGSAGAPLTETVSAVTVIANRFALTSPVPNSQAVPVPTFTRLPVLARETTPWRGPSARRQRLLLTTGQGRSKKRPKTHREIARTNEHVVHQRGKSCETSWLEVTKRDYTCATGRLG